MNWTETEDFLKQAIQAKRGAQTRIAERLGIKVPSVASYVSGSGKIPAEHLNAILEELGLAVELSSTLALPAPMAFLLGMGASPAPAHFVSVEEGRHHYDYGETLLGKKTDLVWYDPETWWVKIRYPAVDVHQFGTVHKTGDNGVATTYLVKDGPFAGFTVVPSRNLMHIRTEGFERKLLAQDYEYTSRKRSLEDVN